MAGDRKLILSTKKGKNGKKGKKTIKETSSSNAKVEYRLGATINMGNFESVRVDLGMSLDCNRDELDNTFKQLKKDVAVKMAEEVKKIKSSGG